MSAPRLRIAFFDFPDVFEDFYPHYGVTQRAFATRWNDTASHALVTLLQREIGDVTWYSLSLKPELREDHHVPSGCRVRFIRSSWLHVKLWRWFYLSRSSWRWRTRWFRPYATIASWAAPLSLNLLRALKHDRPDVIFAQDYSSGKFDALLAIARLLHVPLLAFHTGGLPERYVGMSVRKWTLRRADCLIASSSRESALLTNRFRVAAAHVAVVLTPIDLERFRPLDRNASCAVSGLSPERRYILFVGRLSDQEKRISSLLRCFAQIADQFADTDLLIVGEGNDGEWLRRLALELVPARVRFLGWRSGADALAPLYAAAECLALPSRREGFPTVVGEAMACGTPVIATDVGGVSELVTNGVTGWLLPPEDDAALARGLTAVLADRSRTAAMRTPARARAEARVSPAAVTAGLRDCFRTAGMAIQEAAT